MCEIRNLSNLKYLDAVFILNVFIKHQRLSKLGVDSMLEKAIYGAGFMNWVDILCVLLKARVSINRMASGLWLRDKTWICVSQVVWKKALERVCLWYWVIYT